MLQEITWEQFQEWLAYEHLEPYGEKRKDWQTAMVCASIWNAMFARMGSRKRMRVAEFLLEFTEAQKVLESEGEAPAQPWQIMKFYAKAFAAAANAEEGKKQKREEKNRHKKAAADRAPKRPNASQLKAAREALKRK